MLTIDPPSSPLAAPASLSKPTLTRFLNRARIAIGLPGEVDVLLTTDAQLKSLNRTYRGKNKPTDVLSFPTPPEIAAQHAGDLAISLDTAARQAAAFDHSLETEIKILLLHGLLHLAGEDHETDNGQMATRESDLRTKLKLPTSLIDRTLTPSKNASSRPKRALLTPPKNASSRPKAAHLAAAAERPASPPKPRPSPKRVLSNPPQSRKKQARA